MTYKTIFDAADQGYSVYLFPASGLLFIAVGVALVTRPAFLQEMMLKGFKGPIPAGFGWIFLLFSIFWTVGTFAGMSSQRQAAVAALRDTTFAVVEGPVENFVPMPYEGHKMESFDVGGQHFSYSDYIIKPGFHNAASHGGPIKPGLQVRLSYVGNDILRIEVAE